MKINRISYKDIEEILKFDLDAVVKKNIKEFDLRYQYLTSQERDSKILLILKKLDEDISFSGEHRLSDWEEGWSENLELFLRNKDINSLIPRYHSKYEILRWKGDFIKSITPSLDYKLHICLVDAILNNYVENDSSVFEFGCGPGYHLLRLSSYKKVNLYGADWTESSQKIIGNINKKFDTSIRGFNFNFFEPNFDLQIPAGSVFYTIAALEQVGENFKKFVDFILKKKPEIVINMEPIDELLDDTKLIDFLSIKYFRKRNYLKNFLPYLEYLESIGKIEILKKQRIFYGSFYVEGHSLIIWRPK
jgi:hypothetical protein